MDDLVKTIKAQLYDRLSSPLVFSFSISWLLWNYRVAIILLSSLSPSDKFFAIDLLPLTWLYSQLYWLTHLAVGPILTTAAYIFVLPYAEKFVFEFSLRQRKALKETRQKIEDATPITEEEARELRAAAEIAYREYRSTIKDREEEIAKLKVELRETRSSLEEQREVVPLQPSPHQNASSQGIYLTDSQDELIRALARTDGSPGYAMFSELNSDFGGSPTKLQYDLDALERFGYAGKSRRIVSGLGVKEVYNLTASGRAYAVENLSVDLLG